ncbi:hypothetical protein BDN70DRAFT_818108 [Pholiota conissans]|uniref:CxC2-like cysteine cluster KDZ transposase-associated domain-containing protein n=1 Tax=Pholiota conissans TaxID=109636 RepID=A0A9P5YQE3_9AGAR|nr:hypothetical protein BDN70DRAFT_818108 [Pholiota conissans]
MSDARPNKRAKKSHYHDRISLEDDLEVIHARSSRLTARNMATESFRTPLKGRTTWNIGTTWAPEDDKELALDDSGDWFDVEMQGDLFDSGPSRAQDQPKKKYKRSGTSTGAEISRTLHVLIVCRANDYLTVSPNIAASIRLPLHRIERWTGVSFVKVSLKSLGLEVHLNHAGMRCPIPIPCHQDFRIVHTNGVHEVSFSYCGCHRAIPRHLQLLRRRLYPASQISPQTCFTFSLLHLLHIITLTSKASTYDLYRAVGRLSDGAGYQEHRSGYRPLLRVGLQWRHLKLLKRGGRGHDKAGVDATKAGELAIMCPSCPHPGINLPSDWKDVPEDQKFLYRLLVCLDANFRLKNQLVSNYSADPGLGDGWAYMVGRRLYELYILSQTDQEDISTCVGFQALAQAFTRFARGLRYTGVGGAFCGRGEMILPNGIGNLQKGERYANMDYIFASAVCSSTVSSIDVSYDIACQWFKHLFDRIQGLPSELRLDPSIETRPLIPKFHEPAHDEKNHEQFSFNFAVGVGKSDGEVPERVWAGHNGLGGSTKTQGPGSRQDVLDDHFGFWNWQKYCNMGAFSLFIFASSVEAHRGFTESLPASLVATWEDLCSAWDADRFPKSTPNPFTTNVMYVSEANVKAQLAKEEKERQQQIPALHSMGPSAWLSMGLELEDSQYRLYALYIPGLVVYQAQEGVDVASWENDPNPEDVDLFLPSQLPTTHQTAACMDGLPEAEARLRTAQCHDALAALRRTLRLKTRMVQFKNSNVRGQAMSTRSRALIDTVHQRALIAVEKYRAARRALLAISGPGAWEKTLHPLLNADVRGYTDREGKKIGLERRGIWEDGRDPVADPDSELIGHDIPEISLHPEERKRREGTGWTKNTISWIWRIGSAEVGGDGEGDDDILRTEWAKSRARVQRCKEECLLLLEEMRRVLEFLEWRANWWIARQRPRVGITPELQEGLEAYAINQAAVQRRLSDAFRKIWKTPLPLVDDIYDDLDDDEGDGDDGDDGDGDGDLEVEVEVDVNGDGNNEGGGDAMDVDVGGTEDYAMEIDALGRNRYVCGEMSSGGVGTEAGPKSQTERSRQFVPPIIRNDVFM